MQTLEVLGGDRISDVAKRMVALANEAKDAVMAKFKDIELKANPGDDPEKIEMRYVAVCLRRNSLRRSEMSRGDFEDEARALMLLINQMIDRYRVSHAGNADDEILRFFEIAKRISYAKDRNEWVRAIQNA